MKYFWIKVISIILIFSVGLPAGKVNAQTASTSGPVYIVQEGDSLWDIAYRFHVSQADLANANGIVDYNQIIVGQPLVIPGLAGIEGILTTEQVPFGETLRSLSLRYHLSTELLERLNHLTSPTELYVGYSLVILEENTSFTSGKRSLLGSNQSLLELSILNNTDPWTILTNNQLNSSSDILPGDVLRLSGEEDAGPGGLPPVITSASISTLIQGGTAEIQIEGAAGFTLQGSLMERTLDFSSKPDGNYVALQGVSAMTDPGLYPINLQVTLPDQTSYGFSQEVWVSAGDFLYEILSVDPATLDPEVTGPEDSEWYGLASQLSPDQLWQGIFTLPVEPVFAECYASRFGNRRSYNGSGYTYYHTGVDYCGQVGDPIYAAADGVVVFAGPLTVRGNATMIDHGWGVYSAYMHQSEILVNVGDHVEQGQLIGKVGNTGRVEGPHLHFEILVGGVQVDPLEWLDKVFP